MQPQYQQGGYQQPMHQPQLGYGQPPQQYGQPQFQPQPGYGQPQIQMTAVQPQQYVEHVPGHGHEHQPLVGEAYAPKKIKGFERLESRSGVFIKQKVSAAEVITGCDTENVYYVYPTNSEGDKKDKKIFKAKEKSGCCVRQCMNADCRPFKLKINLEDEDENVDGEPFLMVDRPCRCTFLCCNRPEMLVSYVENGSSSLLGKIKDPWNCCDLVLDVFDKDENLKYQINGNCCQLGLCCKWPCEPCQTIDFEIRTPSGDRIAGLQKRSAGCMKSMLTNADNFSLQFPHNATAEDKALLMCAVMFLDFRHFEEHHRGLIR